VKFLNNYTVHNYYGPYETHNDADVQCIKICRKLPKTYRNSVIIMVYGLGLG